MYLASQINDINKNPIKIYINSPGGEVYSMLGLPDELYTPMFAAARMAGWSAHRIEEVSAGGKIYRPAYKNVCPERKYVPMDERR